MRSTISLAVCLLAVGCISDWKGNPFDSQFASRPHWPDCDGDGWGDPRVDADCINPENEPPPDCNGTAGEWAPNGFDCDDTYTASGSLVGSACPDDFSAYLGTTLTPGDYSVVVAGGREFLMWRDEPVSAQVAHLICEEWAAPFTDVGALPPDVSENEVSAWTGNRDPLSEDPAVGGPVLGMPENPQQLSPLIDQATVGWGLPVWRGWIDMTFDGTDWVFNGPTDQAAVPLDFCASEMRLDVNASGTVEPGEIYEGIIDGSTSDVFIEELFAEMRLVLRIQPDVLPCLEAPISSCGEGLCVPAADVLCERPLQVPNDRELFELGDLECIQQG